MALGALPDLVGRFSSAQTLAIFEKTCFNRSFELEVARAHDAGRIRMPVYLSVGQEHIPAAVSEVLRGPMIFAQHRAHSYYLAFGGDRRALVDELLHKETGCARGMGGSASIHSPAISMFGHSGLMGDQAPIAVGAALASGRRTLCVLGDASTEEDYVLGALGYAATKRAPVLFVCEDNDLSILTPVAARRSWSLADVARAFGMPAVDITDDPWLIAHQVERLLPELPAYLNVRTCRQLWHAGTGRDGPPEWNRFELILEELGRLGLSTEARQIERAARAAAEQLWQERSPKPSRT